MAPPAAAETAAEDESVSLPVGSWLEVDARLSALTTFSRSSQGYELGFRTGRYAYFHAGLGMLRSPQYERYLQPIDTTGSSYMAEPSAAGLTIIDPARATFYYLALGPGVAMWPTRQLNVHLEGGGMIGNVTNSASLVMPTEDSYGVGFGLFAGIGTSFRMPSRPLVFGFDYRIQGIPYAGVSTGESVQISGMQVGHSMFGLVHSFTMYFGWRLESDRED